MDPILGCTGNLRQTKYVLFYQTQPTFTGSTDTRGGETQ